MGNSLTTILLAIVVMLIQGCREPFDVEVASGNSLLVVDGMITDQPGPYLVQLTRSVELGNLDFPWETGATVTIESQSGASEILSEEQPGFYYTREDGIRGVIGEQYRLTIQTNNQELYQSDWKLLKASPPIDSVYYRFREQETEQEVLQGFQIYVDTHDPANQTEYYRYDWTETWEYRVPYSTQFEYLGNDNYGIIEEKGTCWIDQPSGSISISSSTQNETDVILEHPLLYVTTETDRLSILYSVLVRQYAMDQSEFLFWKTLRETVNESGTLFDQQPQSITGNIYQVGSDEPVLGYFSVSAVSSSRLFIYNAELPEEADLKRELSRNCSDTTYTILKSGPFASPNPDREVFNAINRGLVFYDFYREFVAISGYIITTVPCSDCTYHGGNLQKPEYWPR